MNALTGIMVAVLPGLIVGTGLVGVFGFRVERLLFAYSLGLGFGVGLAGYCHLVGLILGMPTAALAVGELALSVSFAIALWRHNALRPPPTPICSRIGWESLVFVIGFLAIVASALGSYVILSSLSPDGGSDAFTIWNFRARAIFRLLPDWQQAFRMTELNTRVYHLDYPPLLPLFVARCWRYVGGESKVIPMLQGLLFLLAATGLLVSTVWMLRSRMQGLWAGSLLLMPAAVFGAANQFADIPLAFFVLSTVCLLCVGQHWHDFRVAATLAGLCASFAVITKNEGQLLVAVILIVRYYGVLRAQARGLRAELARFAAGLLPGLACLLYFKGVVATQANDLLAATTVMQLWERITTVERHVTILNSLSEIALIFGYWPVSLLPTLMGYLALRWDRENQLRREMRLLPATICLMALGGYYCIYVLTPRDLSWHLMWSRNRLLLQLWPLGVLSMSLLTSLPEVLIRDRGERADG